MLRVAVLAPPGAPGDIEDPGLEPLLRTARAMGAALDPVEELDDRTLRGTSALFLSDLAAGLTEASAAAVAAWLERGGRLLWVNHATGRLAPGLLGNVWAEGFLVRRRAPTGGVLFLRPIADGFARVRTVAALVVPHELRPRGVGLSDPRWKVRPSGWLARILGHDREMAVADLPVGAGRLLYVGGADLLRLDAGSTPSLLVWTAAAWLGLEREEVDRRMGRVQRHRLLHGYPMAPLLPIDPPAEALRAMRSLVPAAPRRAIVGILPHPLCDPALAGCGFCTFPHEDYRRPLASRLVAAVIREIEREAPEVPVEAVYLGGGTANLTPPEDLRALGRTLGARFDLRGAEVTLEGVPIHFLARRPRPLEVLRAALPDARLRMSMGVQTFDPAWLERMGRSAFGDAATFAEAIAAARALGAAHSLDLLFNLPGQGLAAMEEDIDRSIDLGVDQICLYHLVLEEGMPSAWAKDPGLLAARPDNPAACDHWLALRERLLAAGYVQRTLTNFERRDVLAAGGGFRYERLGFTPEEVDVLGFGPGGLTVRIGRRMNVGLKTMNAVRAEDYLARAETGSWVERSLALGRRDVAILWLTRSVARLEIDRTTYARLFGADLLDDFGAELSACRDRGLCAIAPDRVEVTPKGMFYADTVAGVLAWRRVEEIQLKRWLRGERPERRHRWSHTFDDVLDGQLIAALEEDPNEARDHGMG